jgi:hypothetical protein
MISKREPALKSFIGQNRSVAETALTALLKLVSHGNDGKTTSLAQQLDIILEEAGVHRSFSIYKERRFTKLGYQAGAVYECIPYFKKLLAETPLNNLLIRACKLYLENDFILAGMKTLANFTYNVTMPCLNCVEKANQDRLVDILQKLFIDLQNKSMNTLSRYNVKRTHVNIGKMLPESDLDRLIIGEMCIQASKVLVYSARGSTGVRNLAVEPLSCTN